MNDHDNDIELIDRYLSGETNPAEREAFEKKLLNDPALRAQLTRVKLAIEGIQANGFREKIALLHENYIEEKRTRNLFKYISGIAASLVILAAAAYLLILQNQRANYYSYFAPYPAPINVRGGNGNLQHEAMVFYQHEEFSKAIEAFNHVAAVDKNEEIEFYLGVSLLGNKKPAEASVIFEKLMLNSTHYEQAARWYLALSYLGLNKQDKAKSLLLKIRESDYQFDRAQKLLSSLQ